MQDREANMVKSISHSHVFVAQFGLEFFDAFKNSLQGGLLDSGEFFGVDMIAEL